MLTLLKLIRSSIRYKLIFLLLISIVVPIGTSIFINQFYTVESLKERTINENARLIMEVRNNIATFLDSLNTASLAPYSNETLDSILSKGLSDIQSESNIFAILQLVSRTVKDVQQVYLYVNKTQRSYLFYNDNFAQESGIPPLELTQKLSPYEGYVELTHLSNNYGLHPLPPTKNELVFSIVRPLYQAPSSVQIGLISIDVQLNALRRLVSEAYDNRSEEFYIINDTGSAVYASNEALIGKQLNETWLQRMNGMTDNSGSFKVENGKLSGVVVYSKIASPILKWTLVKRIPYNNIYAQVGKLNAINTAVTGVFLVVAIFFILYVTIRTTKDFKELIGYMSKIQAGQLDVPINIYRHDEIGVLARHFRLMMNTINDLILREYKLEIANKSNQLKMLQAQINPHFINNSLQSIGNSALMSNAPNVYSLVSSLGQMMHYSMNTKETVVSLDKEIDYINYYLLLQQQRFEEKLSYKLDIDDRTRSIIVPKMILQPIVENYFKHGFHPELRVGNIIVTTYLDNGLLIINVEDNGQGISEERLLDLRKELSETKRTNMDLAENIGLMNVLLRLRLYYDERAGMEIDTLEPYGLRVNLQMPLDITFLSN